MDIDQSPHDPSQQQTSMQRPHGVVANAPYQSAAPVPPSIAVPMFVNWIGQAVNVASQPSTVTGFDLRRSTLEMALSPSSENTAVLGLSLAQLRQITGNRPQTALSKHGEWKYAMRREAQDILDYLYLGPSNAARDRTFLRRAGITKVIAIRDTLIAEARLLAVEHITKEMGIESECVDVPNSNALIRELPRVIRSINQHMLAAPTDQDGVSQGKVLVFCETGNIRSAAVVIAYVMAVFGQDVSDALRFVCRRRFCMSPDEDTKQMLLSYSQLLHAQRLVATQNAEAEEAEVIRSENENIQMANAHNATKIDITISANKDTMLDSPGGGYSSKIHSADGLLVPRAQMRTSASTGGRTRPLKRQIGETMDVEDDRIEGSGASSGVPSREPSAEPSSLNLDMARYENRDKFAPFIDTDPSS